jgi:4-hydroxybenzoate polyprenyltransferase
MGLYALIQLLKRWDIYRVRNWFYYLGFVILGTTISSGIEVINWQVLSVSVLSLAFIFSINDYTDKVTGRKYFVYPLIFLFIGLFFIDFMQKLILIFAITLQLIYSLKPLRLKNTPILGTLCCAFTFPQFFLVGYLEESKFDLRGLSIFLLLVLLSGLLQIIHEVNHMEKDNAEDIKTSAVFFGKKAMEHFCIALLILALVLTYFIYFRNWLNLITLVALFIFYVFTIVDILIFGIQYHSWRNFRILALISGCIWFLIKLK